MLHTCALTSCEQRVATCNGPSWRVCMTRAYKEGGRRGGGGGGGGGDGERRGEERRGGAGELTLAR